MKITLVEILTLILLCLTGLAGALSTPEIAVLPEGLLKYVPLGLIVILALKNAIYVFLDWWDDGQVNRSFKLPKPLPVVLLAGLCLGCVSCATRPDGTRTFAALDAGQWRAVGVEAGATYLDQYKRPVPVTGAKGVAEIQPAPAQETSWLSLGLSLLGM
ncbi:hypothetical protein WJU23_16970 [Prosthecobacter sp. SYSU 5D2]|uniref:hypothetical protein n=1 Tax=Prosthecobacter sp. SYSU 5D2 TaxID=3134134 RepID=UPI0031FEDEC5